MPKRVRIVLGVLAGLFVAIQFVPVPRTNPSATSPLSPPPDVAAILRRSCYDCHSNQTRWPWYAHVAPMSWLVIDHVKDGRANLNLSYWGELPLHERREGVKDVQDQLAAGSMPIRSYLLIHRDARLSPADKEALRAWFASPAALGAAAVDSTGGEHNVETDDEYDER